MPTGNRILNPADCARIVANLDECIALFDRKAGVLNGAEVRAKSLFSLMRKEIIRKSGEERSDAFD